MKPYLILLSFLIMGSSRAQELPPIQKEVLEKNKRLEFLVGEWKLNVIYYSREGSPIREIQSKAFIEPALDGLIYRIRYTGDFNGIQKEVILNWIFYNKSKDEY